MSSIIQSDPLSVQDRLKDMQSILILQGIRAQHDEDPTVLRAVDHAIALLKQRHDKSEKDERTSFELSFVRNALARVERGEATITNIGVDRDIDERMPCAYATLNDAAPVAARPIKRLLKYIIEIVGPEGSSL